MTKTQDNTEKVATANLANIGPVDISYIGGSRFEFTCSDGRRFRIEKNVMDKLIAEKKVKLTAPKRYQEISDSILPDGSTKTHNADGTQKSNQTRVLEKLEAEGYIEHNPSSKDDSSKKDDKSDNEPRRISRKEKRIAAEQAASATNQNMNDEHRNKAERSSSDSNTDDKESKQPRSESSRHSDKQNDERGEDLNGDGIVDEFDDLVRQEQTTSPLVIITILVFSVLSIFLFFFSHAATTTLVHGQTFDLLPDSGITRDPNNQGSGAINQSDNTNVTETQSNSNSSQNGSNSTSSDQDAKRAVTRTDYDPANSVASMPAAGVDQQKVAAIMLQTVRQDIASGDVNAFNQAIDLDKIAGQLATEYAKAAVDKQHLNSAEKDEIEQAWKQTFIDNERQHVVSKDTAPSIFCGRIREVKTDISSNMRIYVVTESISGDHQRICLILDGDGQGGWTIDGVNDPAGYVKMIQEGPTSNTQK